MTPIAPHIEAFLRENLSHHRGASKHTCDSYAYSFQLLFEFAAARLKVTPSSLTLERLDSGLISAFLEYLEDTRRNAPETRNVRLAAIKSFFRFLEYRQPAALEQGSRWSAHSARSPRCRPNSPRCSARQSLPTTGSICWYRYRRPR
jgi:integrase/recombinase XerD